MDKVVILDCENCNRSFERRVHDHNYNVKKGRRVFCSKKCSNEFTKEERSLRIVENRSHLLPPKQNKDPLFVAMTFILTKARKAFKDRSKKILEITIDDLINQWDKQNGICVYTGVRLTLPSAHRKNNRLYTASLDRIDSDKGYEVGNIQFVSIIANVAKGVSTHEEMIEFCNIIKRS